MKWTLVFIWFIILDFPLKAQNPDEGSTPQFLFPEFAMGKVKMKNGSSQSALLNYNTISEKMVYEEDDLIYNMISLEMVDTVFLRQSKFVPEGNVFYKVLVIAPTSLFVQYRGTLIPPGKPSGYGGTSQVSSTRVMSSVLLSHQQYNLKVPSDYTVNIENIYWIRTDTNMASFVNERQFLRLFPDQQDELKYFIKQNRIKFDMIPDLVRLIQYYNELKQ